VVDAGYTFLEHTADAGVIAWGAAPPEAFDQAARGMFALILGMDPLAWYRDGRPMSLELAVAGQDWDELLVNWLAKLLFHFETDHFIPHQIGFKECRPPGCAATIVGIGFYDPAAIAGVGVKAVTYHALEVRITPERTTVHVIFDI